jgi:hypothetical protein
MIPIPEELAKRVLEALEVGEDLVRIETANVEAIYGQYPPDGLGRRCVAARRDFKLIATARDELAALLTPKEATC